MHLSFWQTNCPEWISFIIFLILIIALVSVSELLLRNRILSAEASRIFVHSAVGISCSLSPFIFISKNFPIILGMLFLFLNIIALKLEKFKGIHSQKRESYGTIYFPLSYLFMVSFFWDFSQYFVIAFSILAIADPLATFIGESVPSPLKIILESDKKSFQGSIAMFCSSCVIVYIWSSILLSQFTSFNMIYFILITAIISTLAEMISFKGSDNLSIPLVSFLTMYSMEIKGPNFEFILIFIIIGFFIAYYFKMITASGFIGALIMGFLITGYGGINYLIPIAIFFILSSILSKIIPGNTSTISKGSKRDIIQVYANGGIALLLCIYSQFYENTTSIYLLFLSSIAAATADTWGTELGKLSKTNPVSIINFNYVLPGQSGGITRIGIIGSLLGASIIGFTSHIIGIMDYGVIGIIIAGFSGCIIDSILGASLQAKYQTKDGQIVEYITKKEILVNGYRWMTNDMVNLLSTLSAPILTHFYIKTFYI